MNIKNKIIPVALSLFIGVGSLGIANAAIPVDYQAKMASWIKNDPNPMPMNMNMNMNTTPINKTNNTKTNVDITSATNNTGTSQQNNTYTNSSPSNTGQNNSANNGKNNSNPNLNNQLYNQGFQYCTQVEHQQMMQNMTPEQMVEMDKAWHNSMVKQQKQVQPNTMRNRNSTRGWSNHCGW